MGRAVYSGVPTVLQARETNHLHACARRLERHSSRISSIDRGSPGSGIYDSCFPHRAHTSPDASISIPGRSFSQRCPRTRHTNRGSGRSHRVVGWWSGIPREVKRLRRHHHEPRPGVCRHERCQMLNCSSGLSPRPGKTPSLGAHERRPARGGLPNTPRRAFRGLSSRSNLPALRVGLNTRFVRVLRGMLAGVGSGRPNRR